MTTEPIDPHPPGRIMVVDDSPVIRRILVARLRQAGHHAVEVSDGRQALQAFRREGYEVVISDVSMPGFSGLDLLGELSRESVPPEVILLSGVSGEDTGAAVQALRLGACDFIAKAPSALEAVVVAAEGALEKWHAREQKERTLREVRNLSLTDALTGLGNRRALDDAVRLEVARSRRHRGPLSLAVFQIDSFDRVRATFGRALGDRAIAAFARRLRQSTRRCDALYRCGEEEFAVVLPMTPLSGAERFAERLRVTTAARRLAVGGHQVPLTVSAGVAELVPTDDEDGLALFARATAGLEHARQQGRNRVRTVEEPIALPAGRLEKPAPVLALVGVSGGR